MSSCRSISLDIASICTCMIPAMPGSVPSGGDDAGGTATVTGAVVAAGAATADRAASRWGPTAGGASALMKRPSAGIVDKSPSNWRKATFTLRRR